MLKNESVTELNVDPKGFAKLRESVTRMTKWVGAICVRIIPSLLPVSMETTVLDRFEKDHDPKGGHKKIGNYVGKSVSFRQRMKMGQSSFNTEGNSPNEVQTIRSKPTLTLQLRNLVIFLS